MKIFTPLNIKKKPLAKFSTLMSKTRLHPDIFSKNMEEETCGLCNKKLSTTEKSNFNFNGLCKTCVTKERTSYKKEMEDLEKGRKEGWRS